MPSGIPSLCDVGKVHASPNVHSLSFAAGKESETTENILRCFLTNSKYHKVPENLIIAQQVMKFPPPPLL
jgi:hypothetical protein